MRVPVNVEEDGDNPPFDGVFEFCQAYAGATLGTLRAPVASARWRLRQPQLYALAAASLCVPTIAAARQLNRRLADTAIHWGGGFTHARRDHASAFCFINDTVLAILELLKCACVGGVHGIIELHD